MDLGTAIGIFNNAILQILVLSAPVLLISLAVGLIVSIFQATTSIQEQTLTFVPKLAAILITLMFLGPWMFGLLTNYTVALFRQIPGMVR
jgi:flagellar biosynthetic protein FliQ